MRKVKITKRPVTGDQFNFGLVKGNAFMKSSTNPLDDQVTDNLSAVPRDEANVEAEKGETVVGDINNDGFLEHFDIGGKPHTQGGTPLNIPSGSFIFSNTKDLRIKDPEVLKHFGKTKKSNGYTPAEIAKQYDINKYIQTLKDKNADPTAKRTAQYMLDSNLKKLGELSMVQEQIKGLPDGVPALAENAMGEMNPDEDQTQDTMRYGGYMQEGGNSKFKLQNQTHYSDLNSDKIISEYPNVFFVQRGDKVFMVDKKSRNILKTRNTNEIGFGDLGFGDLNHLTNHENNTLPSGKTQKVAVAQNNVSDSGVKNKVKPTTSKTNTAPEGSFTQYGSPQIQDIISRMGDKVIKTKSDFKTFGNQHQVDPSGTYTSGNNTLDWGDLKLRHGDWINNDYSGGFDQFVKDVQDPTKTDKAAGWFQDKVNQYSTSEFGSDANYFQPKGTSVNPYTRDSKFGQVTYSVPRYFQANKTSPIAEQPVKEEVQKEDIIPAGELPNKTVPQEGGWWLQDITNFANAMTNHDNRYEPLKQNVKLVKPDYSLLDPSRQIANIQEQQALSANQIINTAPGTIARANILANSGKSSAQAADILGNYENQNVGIANNAQNIGAQIDNQESEMNSNYNEKYVADIATLNQSHDNFMRNKKYDLTNTFNNGTTNLFRKRMMEEVMFPQVYTDPNTGHTTFSGKGKELNPFTASYDIYGTAGSAGNFDTNAYIAAINKTKDQVMRNGIVDPKEAMDLAKTIVHTTMKPNSATANQQYMNNRAMYMNGMLGSNIPTEEYGGTTFPWEL